MAGGTSSSNNGASGVATGAGTRVDVTLKLSQLQNLCKRDPAGYQDDYDAQIRRLASELGILALSPSTAPSASLTELIQFAAAVSSSSYKGPESEKIANMLIGLLVGSSSPSSSSTSLLSSDADVTHTASVSHVSTMPAAALQLHRDVRKSCVSALILMRNKGALEPLRLLELFFRIMAVVPDKALRELLYRHMVNDIKNINKTKRDEKVNRSIQSFLHRVVSTHGTASSSSPSDNTSVVSQEAATDVAAKRATDMVCELYRRRVWTDDRTVAIVASAVQSKNSTVMCRAIRFFLGIEEKMADDAKEKQEEDWEAKNRIDYHHHSKKTVWRQRHVERQLKNRKKAREKKENSDWMDDDPDKDKGVEAAKKLYPAIELLRDPQGLAESVLKKLRTAGSYKYEVKLLMINFVTRLVGNHQLLLLPLYSFLTKYLTSHQRDVTAVLAYTVQACHEHVPPDEVYMLLKTIAHNFITERCSEEEMAVGINAARAICARVPSVMSEEESKETTGSSVMDIEAFARDLAAFANHRDRSVSIAGKAWTNFVREVHPGLLQGKDRGLKGTAMYKSGARPLRYGEVRAAAGVEGADLLAAYESRKAAKKRSRDDEWEDVEEVESGDEGDWVEGNEAEDEAGDHDDDDDEAEEDEGDEALGEAKGDSEKEDDSEDDESAPELVILDANGKPTAEPEAILDLSKMTPEERNKLKQKVSSTRIFTSADFEKMKKLVEREQRAMRDPREAARRKRAIAKGQDPDALSSDSSDEEEVSDDEQIRITGAVNPSEIQALAKKKRQTKVEKLQSIIAGRSKFEAKSRAGGATNIEKKRTKNFVMAKFSRDTRTKSNGKSGQQPKRGRRKVLNHEAKKRRRKF